MNELIPLSVLELNLAPPGGWSVYLAGHGIAVVEDDIGRPAIARAAARHLLIEYREAQAREVERLRRHREEVERQAIEQDEQFRAQLHPGIPLGTFPDGVDPIIGQIEAEKASDPRRKSMREELLDAQFGRSPGDEIPYTYHPIGPASDDER